MHSSTSPSDRGLPRRALGLLGLALAALVGAAAYTLWLNPEVRFHRHSVAVKRAWAARLAREHTNQWILCGGSSAAFSIDGERLLRLHGIPLVNFGLHAGMGPLFLTAIALEPARPGDTLILAMEPALLTPRFDLPDLGAQMGFALGEPGLIRASRLTGEPIHWVDGLVRLRPGAYHLFTLLGKLALRRPLYRYAFDDVQPSGWQKARDIRPVDEPVVGEAQLTGDAVRLLAALKHWGTTSRVEVVYSLPWCYVSPTNAAAARRYTAGFLLEVSRYLPVLRDPALGVHTVAEHFADTCWHLTEAGAALRTESLADQIRAGKSWTTEELQQLSAKTLSPTTVGAVPSGAVAPAGEPGEATAAHP